MEIQKYDEILDHFLQQIHNWSKMGCFVKLGPFGVSAKENLAQNLLGFKFYKHSISDQLPVLRNVYISEYYRFVDQNVYSSPNRTLSRDFPKLPVSFKLHFDR